MYKKNGLAIVLFTILVIGGIILNIPLGSASDTNHDRALIIVSDYGDHSSIEMGKAQSIYNYLIDEGAVGQNKMISL